MLNQQQRRIWWALAALASCVVLMAASLVAIRVQQDWEMESIVDSHGGRIRWIVDRRFPAWALPLLPKALRHTFCSTAYMLFDRRSPAKWSFTDDKWIELHTQLAPYRGRIVSLFFDGTDIGNATLSTLREYPNLIHAGLSGTRVSDTGLAHLAGLSKLRSLTLDGTPITEEGLAHLRTLTNLTDLSVVNTGLPESALMSLEVDMPALMISDD